MKEEIREQARELRGKGYSINEIAKELSISKSSASVWTRNIILTEEQRLNLDSRDNLSKAAIKLKELIKIRHEEYKQNGLKLFNSDLHFRDLVFLYWGEGDKSGRIFNITNSDYSMCKYISDWLIASKFKDKIYFQLRCHKNNPITDDELFNYWKNIAYQRFSIVRDKENYIVTEKTRILTYGTLAIKGPVELYYNIAACINTFTPC